MDIYYLTRLRVGAEPPRDDAARPDPREVDRIITELKWPDEYAVLWICFAAGIPTDDGDGHPIDWTRKQLRGLLMIRHLYQHGRLHS